MLLERARPKLSFSTLCKNPRAGPAMSIIWPTLPRNKLRCHTLDVHRLGGPALSYLQRSRGQSSWEGLQWALTVANWLRKRGLAGAEAFGGSHAQGSSSAKLLRVGYGQLPAVWHPSRR